MRKRESTAIFGIRLLPACFLATICGLLLTTCYLEGDINALKPTSSDTPDDSFNPGSGTDDDPYKVHDDETLRKVGTGDGWEMDSHYIQIDDIVLSPKPWDPIGYYIDDNDNNTFTGSFDGGIYTISNLKIIGSTDDYQGLFGYIKGPNAQVINVKLENVDINGDKNVGGVAGYVADGGHVTNCYSTGTVDGNENVGGVVGHVKGGGYVTNCSSAAEIGGNEYVGGVVGYIENGGRVAYCFSACNITGRSNATGGVVGYVDVVDDSDDINVENCFSTGIVTGANYVGGVAGTNNKGKVANCYSTSDIRGNNITGGVAGLNQNGGNVTNCYSTGPVASDFDTAGGVVGMNTAGDATSKVENCVALGPSVTSSEDESTGRVAGDSSGTLSNNYANSNMKVNGWEITADIADSDFGENKMHGANVDEDSYDYGDHSTGGGSGYYNKDFWEVTLGWDDFDEHWEMHEGDSLPILQGFPGVAQNPEIVP